MLAPITPATPAPGAQVWLLATKAKAKASDIDTIELLTAIERQSIVNGYPYWVQRWDMTNWWPHIPANVLLAKLDRLVRRGLLRGCACGCRGDFELTSKGNQLIEHQIDPPADGRPNRCDTLP